MVCAKQTGDHFTGFFLFFVLFLPYSALITLYIHHFNHLPVNIFNSLAPLSFHCTWAPECSERKITKYKTLQIVATINPWSASSIWAPVMPSNHISFPSLAISFSVVLVSTIHLFSKNSVLIISSLTPSR